MLEARKRTPSIFSEDDLPSPSSVEADRRRKDVVRCLLIVTVSEAPQHHAEWSATRALNVSLFAAGGQSQRDNESDSFLHVQLGEGAHTGHHHHPHCLGVCQGVPHFCSQLAQQF